MEIINAKKEYMIQIEELLEVSFGSNYMSSQQITDYIKRGTLFKLAIAGSELLGLILFIPADESYIEEHVQMDKKDVEQICGGKKSLICKSACTYDKFRESGVGKALLQKSMEEIAEKGYGAVFTTLWEYHGKVPAEKMFVDCFFKKGKELKMPWYHDTEYVCSVCKGRCHCDGIIYYRKLCT